ncbi:OmpA family protein [Streptomyces sp. NPDC058653]|uniref:OmpA family protein n=1 Tax=Streptomyces sp. NPDC058653 TaxID=3346576 RepID=UPI00364BCF58
MSNLVPRQRTPVGLGLVLLTSVAGGPAHAAGADPAATAPSHRVISVVHKISTVTGSSEVRREETGDRVEVALSAGILFGKDSARLSASAERRIAEAARSIREAGSSAVAVAGHTDNLGSAAHGLTLSKQRADAVTRVLQRHLPNKVRLTARGYGEARPVADNDHEAGRKRNRRVTLTFHRGR